MEKYADLVPTGQYAEQHFASRHNGAVALITHATRTNG
jgi:hypothetical protein